MDQQGAMVEVEKVCGKCGLSKPLDQFSYKYRESGIRLAHCKTCMAGYQRGRLSAKRQSDLAGYLERIKDTSDPENYGAVSRIEAVVRAMMLRFGGLDRFTGYWFEFIQYARANGKDHLVQRSLEVLSRFIEISDRQRATRKPDTQNLADKELSEYIRMEYVRVFFEDPELGAAILDELGWTVVPPEESETDEPSKFYPFYKSFEAKEGERLEAMVERF